MNDNQARAIIGIMLRGQDVLAGIEANKMGTIVEIGTYDAYLGQAQQILDSSYTNYKSPVNDSATIGQAIQLLTVNGYYITPPGEQPPP